MRRVMTMLRAEQKCPRDDFLQRIRVGLIVAAVIFIFFWLMT